MRLNLEVFHLCTNHPKLDQHHLWGDLDRGFDPPKSYCGTSQSHTRCQNPRELKTGVKNGFGQGHFSQDTQKIVGTWSRGPLLRHWAKRAIPKITAKLLDTAVPTFHLSSRRWLIALVKSRSLSSSSKLSS